MPIDEGPRSKPLMVIDGGEQERWFTGFGDQHWGATGCWKDGVRKAVDEIGERNALWVGMGNYTNCAWAAVQKHGLSRDMAGEPFVDDQFVEFRDIIRPIAPLCIGLIAGRCHEGWLETRDGFGLVRLLVDNIGLPKEYYLGLNARFVIKVGQQRYRTHAWHGSGGAVTDMGKFNALLRMQRSSDSDLYLMAHVHQALAFATYFTEARGDRERQHKRLLVCTGHFQYRSDYADSRNLAPGKMGLVWIRLGAERWDAHAIV